MKIISKTWEFICDVVAVVWYAIRSNDDVSARCDRDCGKKGPFDE